MIRTRRNRAFTLIELLVVISILALLVAMLIPSLNAAREITRFTICRAEMRNAAQSFPAYAAAHQGRYPGGGMSHIEHWYITWNQILNREYYHSNSPMYYPPNNGAGIPYYSAAYGDEPTCGPLIKFWSFWDYDNSLLKSKYLVCASYKAWGNPGPSGTAPSNRWSRPWQTNNYTSGSHYEDVGGYGGKPLLPSQFPNPTYDEYHLGSLQDSFVAPASKWLLWDAEAGDDYYHPRDNDSYPNGSGKLIVGDGNPHNGFAPWCADGGQVAFRHLLPPDMLLWQTRGRASLGYLDGHVDMVNPNMPQYKIDYFVPQ
jgi:prepilin-type N-terminal cleavage/methylation domain-containing protein